MLQSRLQVLLGFRVPLKGSTLGFRLRDLPRGSFKGSIGFRVEGSGFRA